MLQRFPDRGTLSPRVEFILRFLSHLLPQTSLPWFLFLTSPYSLSHASHRGMGGGHLSEANPALTDTDSPPHQVRGGAGPARSGCWWTTPGGTASATAAGSSSPAGQGLPPPPQPKSSPRPYPTYPPPPLSPNPGGWGHLHPCFAPVADPLPLHGNGSPWGRGTAWQHVNRPQRVPRGGFAWECPPVVQGASRGVLAAGHGRFLLTGFFF